MTVVLALQPHSRRVGYAVFEENELVDWGSRDLTGWPISDRVMSGGIPAVRKMIERWQPQVIVLPARTRPAQTVRDRLLRIIRIELSLHSCGVANIPRERIHATFSTLSGATVRNRQAVMIEIGRRFPELRPLVPKPRRAQDAERSRVPMFDAVALAITYLHQQ